MDETDARAFIELRLQPDVDPVLTTDEVAALVPLAQCPDADGLAPGDDGYSPTWDARGCHAAIAAGYEIKYAKAVGRFSFTTDGQTFTRNQTLDHLEHQRAIHARKVQRTLTTGRPG